MALARDVVRRAAAQPERPAVVGPCGSLSFADLANQARKRADQVRRCDAASPADPIVTTDAEPVGLLVDLLAADLLGVSCIVTDATWPHDMRHRTITAAIEASRKATEQHDVSGCLVVFTSGSTGDPRPLVRTQESWTYSFPTFSALSGIGEHDTVLIPGPMSATLFLYGALHGLATGAAIHPLARWSPTLAANASRTCTVAHLVPAMLDDLTARIAPDTNRLRLVVCAGAHLDGRTEAKARALRIHVVDYYGAAELSFVGIRRPDAPPGTLRPFPGVDVVVRDGLIRVRSPFLALGLDRDADGFATVGDRGTLTDDGTLVVEGRSSNTINCGGHTIAVEAVEQVLRQAPGVADAAVFGTPHARLGEVVTAVVEPEHKTAVRRSGLRRFVASRLQPSHRPRLWYAVDRLPRVGAGKIARARIAAGFSDGTLGARPLP